MNLLFSWKMNLSHSLNTFWKVNEILELNRRYHWQRIKIYWYLLWFDLFSTWKCEWLSRSMWIWQICEILELTTMLSNFICFMLILQVSGMLQMRHKMRCRDLDHWEFAYRFVSIFWVYFLYSYYSHENLYNTYF